MPISVAVSRTPYYVLLDGNRPTGPAVAQLAAAGKCPPIFGFSDREAYAKFRESSQLALTPYPLVKGFLSGQIGAAGDSPCLIIIDAAGPCEPNLQAATMSDVLEAQEQRKARVSSAIALVFDQTANAYRTEDESA